METTLESTKPPEIVGKIEPGVYEGMSAEAYHAIDACSQTALNIIRTRSPAHWDSIRRGLVETSTEARERGTAAHAAILEPEAFAKQYAVYDGPLREGEDDLNLTRKADKEAWETFQLAHPYQHPLRPREGKKIIAMRDAVWNHRWASMALRSPGRSELTLIWEERVVTDDGTSVNVRCKCRIDKEVVRGRKTILDLKTCKCASKAAFTNAIGVYGYDIQASHYMAGANACGIAADEFAWIAVENEPHHGVVVYLFDGPSLLQGRLERNLLLKKYARCLRDGVWPGYEYSDVRISLNDWTFKNRGVDNG